MRHQVFASAGLVGIVCTFIVLPVHADGAVPVRARSAPARHLAAPALGQRHGRSPSLAGDAAGCTSNYGVSGEYFVGEPANGEPNYAGGYFSGVAAGDDNEACDIASVIGGGNLNVVGNQSSGAAANSFIGAGVQNGLSGYASFIGAGFLNGVTGNDSFVGAGEYGSAVGHSSFVGAGGYEYPHDNGSAAPGTDNIAGATDSFVGAGDLNQITSNGNGSFIGAGGYIWAESGGPYVSNEISGVDSFIGAGDQNYVAPNDAFIGAGTLNSVLSSANYSVLTGGYGNTISGQKGSLGGGEANKVAGSFATIPGGYKDEALGNESFAAGSQAEARYAGSFVWSDYTSSEKPQTDSAINEFVARASGGVYFFSSATSSSGVHLAAGSGTWSSLSDRNAKTNIVPLDDASILAKVESLPISAWQYKTEHGVRHAGPMAQDFYAAFGLGEDDRHITAIDEDGVALAAIKALRADEKRKDADIAALRSELRHLEATVAQRNR